MALRTRRHIAFSLLLLFLVQLAVVAVHTHEGSPVRRSWNGTYLGEDRLNCPICYFVDNTPFFLTVSCFSLFAVSLLLVLVLPKYEAAPIRWADHAIPSRAPPFFYLVD